ncbi:hypothetical protein JY96_09350 [Aquabacterium sp. NJ1]|uniref:hypothetical protein n=1 Tax=Aquabacterium sp. NJ1 TaxID=1538295 RepID=UPI00052E174A|nr:hypothetical protein [Aquabacterium sp. NJ1]KGM40167.1 hypothetical protein JY96_09350 [Aquabacterium sp. NJ1]
MNAARQPVSATSLSTAEALNLGCYCRTLNPMRLQQELEADSSLAGMTLDTTTSLSEHGLHASRHPSLARSPASASTLIRLVFDLHKE